MGKGLKGEIQDLRNERPISLHAASTEGDSRMERRVNRYIQRNLGEEKSLGMRRKKLREESLSERARRRMDCRRFEKRMSASMGESKYQMRLPADVAANLEDGTSIIWMTILVDPIGEYPLRFVRHRGGGWRSNKEDWKRIMLDHPTLVGEYLRFTPWRLTAHEVVFKMVTENQDEVNNEGFYVGACKSEGSKEKEKLAVGLRRLVLCKRWDAASDCKRMVLIGVAVEDQLEEKAMKKRAKALAKYGQPPGFQHKHQG